jgi:ABC-type polysaccharide/polyol phosphate export permease
MQELVIEAGHYWQDLWRYRELFQVLGWRNISVRYKQTVIGIAWALIRPFLMMVVFTVIFGKLAKLPSDGTVPYALMVFVGTINLGKYTLLIKCSLLSRLLAASLKALEKKLHGSMPTGISVS